VRQFSGLEKQIIQELVNHPVGAKEGMIRVSKFLEDHYVGPTHDLSIFINMDKKSVLISVPQPGDLLIREKVILIATLFNLLRDLREEGKLSLIGETKNITGSLGNQFKNGQTLELTSDLGNIIIDYFDKLILISEDLRHLVNTGFKDPEHERHRQTMIVSVAALIIAVLLGLWGIFKDVFQ